MSEASTAIAEEFNASGDLDAVQASVAATLVSQGAPDDLRVTITPVSASNAISDAGRSHVAYKARSNPTIGLNVPVSSVNERTITNSGSTFKDEGHDSDVEGHVDTAVDHVHVDDTKTRDKRHNEGAVQTDVNTYHQANQRTYDEVVTKMQSTVAALTSKLVHKLTTDDKYHDGDNTEYADEEFKFDDWTKKNNVHEEDGDKDKKNWAAWLEDGLGALQSVLELPIPLVLPGVGPILRKVSKYGLGIDLAKKGAGVLAVRGKVRYKDTTEDGQANDTRIGHDDGHKNRDRTVTSNNTDTLTRELNRIGTELITGLKHAHSTETGSNTVVATDVKTQTSGGSSNGTDKDNYTYDANHTNGGGSAKARAHQGSRSYRVLDDFQETVTRPYLDARIIDGDGEVSQNEFPSPSADRKQ